CIAVESNTDGAPVVIHNCNEDDGDNAVYNWTVSFFTRQNAGPQPIQAFGNKCIDVTDGVNADGTKLQIWTCVEGSANQQYLWINNGTQIQWAGTDFCIDLTDGKSVNGQPIQIWECARPDNNPNQDWFVSSV
ncbi:ricin B lectin domain-containing protein, partial [Mycena polygramma]